jgi:uncharacterized membrane protein YeiB
VEQLTNRVASTTVASRILGIDMARAVAVVGMVMVHIGPEDVPGADLAAAAYRTSHGRASVLFVVLAGIGVSLLAGAQGPRRGRAVAGPLLWRSLVLLPAGLWLQVRVPVVAVILQYYAVYFVIALAALRLADRWLLAAAAGSAVLGPMIVIRLQQVAPHLYQFGVPRWDDAGRIARDIMVTGYYPVVVWAAPLLLGMWLGRRDLRSADTARRLLAGGALVAATGFVVSDLLVALVGPATSSIDWRRLAAIVPHNEMPLWALTSTAIAVAVLGACLLLARALPTVTWPLVALGQLALTAYVLHLLVLDLEPGWLLRDTVGAAWVSVARFTLVAVLLATAWRALAFRGPFEVLLRPPWTARPADASGHRRRGVGW